MEENVLWKDSNIVGLKLNFLREMNKILSIDENDPDRPIYYLDETRINKNHSHNHFRQDLKSDSGIKTPFGQVSC